MSNIVIWACEQRRGLKNVLNSANVTNVRFCSVDKRGMQLYLNTN